MKTHIVQVGDPVLRKKAHAVPKKDIGSPKLTAILKRMQELLRKEEYGVAIAAPQIGEPLRMFVVSGKAFLPEDERKKTEEDTPVEIPSDMVFINPELVRLSRAAKNMSEGCLSVRNQYGSVKRHEKATVKAIDKHGKAFTYHGFGLIAQIFQHEIDHLDGILFIDKAATLDEQK